jgi:hypothetical protein
MGQHVPLQRGVPGVDTRGVRGRGRGDPTQRGAEQVLNAVDP